MSNRLDFFVERAFSAHTPCTGKYLDRLCPAPLQMTGDHKALMDALGEVGLHVTAMCTSADTGESRKAAQAALAALTTMRAPCEEHFALEENEAGFKCIMAM